MNSFYRASFCVMFLLLGVVLKAQVNPNGGFENALTGEQTGTNVVGWDFQVGAADVVYEIVTDSVDVHSGSQALKVTVNSVGANPWEPQAINTDFLINPSDSFTVTAWAKTDVEGVIVNFTVGSLAPNYSEYGRVHQAPLGLEWQQFTWDVTIPSTSTEPRAGVPIHLGEASNGDFAPFTVYLDDIVVTPKGVINPNGGFEDAIPGEQTGTDVRAWDFQVGAADVVYEIVTDSVDVHSGAQGLKVTINAVGANPWEPQAINQEFAIMPGDSFSVSAWAKTDIEGVITNFTVGSLAPNYSEYGRVHQALLGLDWQEFTWIARVPLTSLEPRAGVPIHFGEATNGDFAPFTIYLDDVKVIKLTGGIVDVEDNAPMPDRYSLSQNYPNPFNPSTTISFNLPQRSDVHLVVIDVLGKVVSELAAGSFEAGQHDINFDASQLASGVYFYRLEAGQFISTKKLVLLK